MNRRARTERRRFPRIEHKLPIKLAANGYDFSTSTQNVSCAGAYCSINKYIPPFTKVVIRLTLPVMDEEGSRNYNVECKGVVVRSEDSFEGGFNLAIFFNEIREDNRRKISEYVRQFLPKESSFQRKA